MADKELELARARAKAKLKLRRMQAQSKQEPEEEGMTAEKAAGIAAGFGFNANEFAPGLGAAVQKGIAAVDAISGGRVGNLMAGEGFKPSEQQQQVKKKYCYSLVQKHDKRI